MIALLRMHGSEPDDSVAAQPQVVTDPTVRRSRRDTRQRRRHRRSTTVWDWLQLNGVSTLVLIGAVVAFVELRGDVRVLTETVSGMRDRLSSFEKRFDEHTHSRPGGTPSATPTSSGARGVVPQASASASSGATAVAAPSASSSARPGKNLLPDESKVVAPQVCVARRTKRKFACETAARCWPTSEFTPEHVNDVAARAGADPKNMLLCDPR
jgi:hypothetical protein